MTEALACTAPIDHALMRRVAELQACFVHIAKTRMQGIALLNPSLRVRALGFETIAGDALNDDEEVMALGVLVTPWFMNLLLLPVVRSDRPARVGQQRIRRIGDTEFAFLGMHEELGVGSFEACSLFSPMFEFQNAEAAECTAERVLELLRKPQHQMGIAKPAQQKTQAGARSVPTRRSFFLGLSSVEGGSNV